MTSVRFPPDLVRAAERLAEHDGLTLSAWIRREVQRELDRRQGTCSACGQPMPPPSDQTAPEETTP
jgi:hypothetical protein